MYATLHVNTSSHFFALLHTSSHFFTGTYLESSTENGWGGSGGGFSAIFDRPAYQTNASGTVANYLATASPLPPSSLYAAGGRAVPDVAALCTNFQVYSGGAKAGTLTGTSAATPTFAGLVATINDLRAKAGKKSVGFINPVLYAAGAKLGFDVTTGNNKNSGCKAGFPAQKGWDPVTGLGTPSFATLQDILNNA